MASLTWHCGKWKWKCDDWKVRGDEYDDNVNIVHTTVESESDIYVYVESESCYCCFVSHITLCLWLTVFLCFHHCFVRCVFVFEGDPLPRGNSHKLSSGRNWHWVNTRPGGGEMKRISHLWRKIELEPPLKILFTCDKAWGCVGEAPLSWGGCTQAPQRGRGGGSGFGQ